MIVGDGLVGGEASWVDFPILFTFATACRAAFYSLLRDEAARRRWIALRTGMRLVE